MVRQPGVFSPPGRLLSLLPLLLLVLLLALSSLPGALVSASRVNTKFSHGATCVDARAAFCQCKRDLEEAHPELCRSIVTQCRESFCRPLCLRMAWGVTIHVRCDRAPAWRGCRAFAREIKLAEKAISAQFQAHVCANRLGCCTNATRLVDWVETHVFADQYPNALLPVASCTAAASPASVEAAAAGAAAEASENPEIAGFDATMDKYVGDAATAAALRAAGLGSHEEEASTPEGLKEKARAEGEARARCGMCERVLDVEVHTFEKENCSPRAPSGDVAGVPARLLQPLSMHERCLYLSDMVGNLRASLQAELRENVCSCAGCCAGGCFFREKKQDWLKQVVEDVTASLIEEHESFLQISY